MAEIVKIDPENPDIDKIKYVASLVRAGKIVALPTETVYGLTCNLDDTASVAKLYEVKGRPEHKQFTVHIARKGDADVYAKDLPKEVYKLIDKYWPGPLTLICNARSSDSTIGIRCPAHKVTSLIIEASFAKIGMPSANLSGETPCLTVDEVNKCLGDRIDCIVDASDPDYGISSTIVDVSKEPYKILRKGAIPFEDVLKVLKNIKVLFVCTGNTCRSVMARYYFEHAWKDDPLKQDICVEFNSCGTMGIENMPASYGASAVLAEEGIESNDHFSKKLSPEIISEADIIVAMTQTHKKIIQNMVSGLKNVFLLSDLIEDPSFTDVPDPVGGSIADYSNVFSLIKQSQSGLFKLISKTFNDK